MGQVLPRAFARRFAIVLAIAVIGAMVSVSSASAGTGAKLTIAPTSWNFGSQVAGTTGSLKAFTVKNTGTVQSTSAISFSTTGTNASEYEIAGGGTCSNGVTTLGPGVTCTINARFHPAASASGNRTAKLVVSAATGGNASASLTGTATNAHLVISPPSRNYGSVAVNGGYGLYVFTVTNDGTLTSGPLSDSLSGGGASQFDFFLGDPCAGDVLVPTDTCDIYIGFDPTSGGNKSATLNVTASPGGTVHASVTGTGTIAKLVISPGSHNFGSLPNGTGPTAPFTFTVTNNGTAESDYLSSSITGANASDFDEPPIFGCFFPGVQLDPGESATCNVKFDPDSPVLGNKSATLNVSAGPGEGTPHAGLSGKSTAPANLYLDYLDNDFGNVHQGDTSAPFTFTVTNNGPATSSPLDSFALSDVDAADFAVSDGSSGTPCDTVTGTTTLAPLASCTFDVTFTPSGSSGTTENATVTVSTSNSWEGAPSATLEGTSIIAVLGISPTDNDFDSVDPATFTVTNSGTDVSGTLNFSVNGGDSTSFAITGGTCSSGSTTLLAGGDSCTIVVMFDPQTAGPLSATLDVTGGTGEGTPQATLHGTG
jgi:hypothetical protein